MEVRMRGAGRGGDGGMTEGRRGETEGAVGGERQKGEEDETSGAKRG